MIKETKEESERLKSALLNLLEDQQSNINKLKESEKFNRLLFEKSPVGIVLCRMDGIHIDANPAFYSITGIKESELSSVTIYEITPPEYLEKDQQNLDEIRKHGSFGPTVKEIIRRDNKRIFVKISGVKIERENEELVLVSMEDITRQKEDEKLLIERERLFRSLYENSNIGFYRTTPDGRILLANPTLIKMLGYETYEEFISRNLEVDNYEPKYHRRDFKEKAAGTGEIKGWEDIWIKKDGTELYIRESAKVVYDEKGEISYYEGTVEDITESKIALKALKESEEIYRTIFATVEDTIMISNMDDGRIITCNSKTGGYKPEELIGKTSLELKLWIQDEDRKKFLDLIKLNGKVTDYEARLRKKDGTTFVASISSSPIIVGGTGNILTVIRDITQRKIDEEKIRQSEERFRTAFYISPDSVNINRLSDGLYVSVNRGFTQLTGYTEEEVLGKTSSDINIWADQESRKKLVEGIREKGQVMNLEAPFRMKDGSIRYALMSASLLDLDGVPHILNITRDITERKEAEKKQWELREELHTTLYSIGDAVISTDKEGLVKQMNPIAENLTGWKEEEARNRNLSEVFNIICEDNGTRVENPVAKVIREGVIVGLANHTVLISKDGRKRPIADSGAPIRDKEGNITGVVMVFRDQTEERKAQEKLLRNEERMRAIVEGTPNLFFYTQDEKAKTTYVSPTVEIITGYSVERWLAEPSWFITDSPMNENAKALTYKHLEGDFSENRGLLEVRHADGFPIILEVFEYPIMKNGKIVGLQGVAHNATRRIKAEKEVQKTNETLNNLIKSSPLAMISLDLDEKITLWNPAAERIYGWSRLEALNKNIQELFIYGTGESPELAKKIFKQPISNYEAKRRRKDGSVIDVSISSVLLYDMEGKISGVLSLSSDISSRKRYEETLKKLYQATEQSPVSIIITDVNGNIEYVNPNLCAVSGYSFNEVVGQNPRIFKSGSRTKAEYKELWDTILEGNQWKGEMQNKKKDGSFYWESASISPIRNDEGAITHFIAVKEDITHKKKIMEELILSKNRAEDANKTKDLFLANMSHELRTPLIGILGYSDLLTDLLDDEEKIEMAKGIKRSGKRLLNTLNMILNFTKIEADKYEINLKPINVKEELDAIYKMFYGAAAEKGLKFLLDVKDPDLILNLDTQFFDVIMENLINNALKFTSKGYIKISASKTKNENVTIKVKDTGIGISKEHFSAIFEEFRQVSEGINRDFQGTGLGLSIAKKYVEMMHGTIKVQSKLGEGTAFTITFPAYSKQ